MNVLGKKISESKDNFIFANNLHGKSIKLLVVPHTQTGGADARSSSIRRRSQLLEKVYEAVSSPGKGNSMENVTCQQASVVCRNREQFNKSAEKAGVKIITKFSREINVRVTWRNRKV